jgi:hypothetical protein
MSKIRTLTAFILFGLITTFLFGFLVNKTKASDWGIGFYLGDSGWGIDLYYGYPYYYYYPYYSYYDTYPYYYYPYYDYSYYYYYYPYYWYDYYPSFTFVYEDYEYEYDYQPAPQPQPQPQPNPQVDLKVNGSDSSLFLPYSQKTITLSWTSQYADSCQALGDWSGSKPLSGSEQITLSSPKTYHFTLVCRNPSGKEASDSVSVTLQNPGTPRVITKLISW